MFVFDASPLIVLASAGRLSLLETFDRQLVVPRPVRVEAVDTGLESGYADARRLKTAIDDGRLSVQEVERTDLYDELSSTGGLSEADASVIAHASANEAVAIMDERIGRTVAEAEGVQTRGTAFVVLSRVRDGAISAEEGKAIIDELVEGEWYCSTDLYRKILSTLEDM